jgi:membrane-associated phospholipid phosphatase
MATYQRPPETVTEPLIEFDRQVRKAVLPHRHSPPAKAIGWLSAVGDQAQMRLVCAGTIVVGILRRDPRLTAAGARMLLAHEAATLAKDVVKRQVVRARPRSSEGKSPRPRVGDDKRKEQSSFPSGHSAGAMAVAQALAGAYPKHAAAARVAAASVGLGRIPGCAHYPTDIAAGGAIGAGAGSLVNVAWRWATRRLFRPL